MLFSNSTKDGLVQNETTHTDQKDAKAAAKLFLGNPMSKTAASEAAENTYGTDQHNDIQIKRHVFDLENVKVFKEACK